MPLDPDLKAILDQLAQQPGPKARELPAPDARAMFAALMTFVGPKDVPIGKVADLICAGPAGDIPLRVYTPAVPDKGPLPALVFYHGGGFVIGNIETHDGICRMLANEAQVCVVSVDYRLAPEHKFPAAVEDALAALRFVATHAAELGIDAMRIAVGGDSAGGALAAIVAQIVKKENGPAIAFQLLLFPVTQIGMETDSFKRNAEGYFLERADLDWFFDCYVPRGADKSDPWLSPLYARSFEGLPPAYLMAAELDPLHDEGLLYAEKLQKAGIACQTDDCPNLVHDFIYFAGVLPRAAQALKRAAEALKAALKAG